MHESKILTVQDYNDTPVPGTRPLGLYYYFRFDKTKLILWDIWIYGDAKQVNCWIEINVWWSN